MNSVAADIFRFPDLSGIASELEAGSVPSMGGIDVTGITADSRNIHPGNIFVAIDGATFDGHNYLGEAVQKGCAALVVQAEKAAMVEGYNVPVLKVVDTRIAFAKLAAAFYGHPEQQLIMVGVTGTNGKTTTCYILESIIKEAGFSPGVIGTVSYRYQGFEKQATLTTPEPDELFNMFRDMVDNGVTHLLMEVSSHSVVQKRLAGLNYDVAVFTNLTRDHLDFHADMDEYFQAKKELFTGHLKNTGAAVVLGSSERSNDSGPDWGSKLVDELRESGEFGELDGAGKTILECGDFGEIRLTDIQMDFNGIKAKLLCPSGQYSFHTPLTGRFNIENILAAAGAGVALGLNVEQICNGISGTAQVPGRLQRVGDGLPAVFVDFAHTPDALANVIKALKSLGNNRLIVLFGCGGDRDRGKRRLMGEIAARLAEVVVVTSDNPRSEDPMDIIDEIERGIAADSGSDLKKNEAEHILTFGNHGYDTIESRKEAIETVIAHCKADDVVLICGKGHEDYQIIGEEKIHFDDRQEALRCIAERNP